MPTNLETILVVGGAGFIGSHMVLALQDANYHVVVLDNLSKGHQDAVMGAHFIHGDLQDVTLLNQLFATYHFSAVMHFASFIEVAESVQDPAKYYQNNVAATLNLLDKVVQYRVPRFIFSSTAAVYGEPLYSPIDEAHPIKPINPYGRSKWMVEEIIKDYATAYGSFHYAILRYFNAAGADPKCRLRERHDPESHLIPLLLQVANGVRPHLYVYGRDYATKDGTCVRDYVHVTDLCDAHLRALQQLHEHPRHLICNLGTNSGHSVQEVIDSVRRITKHPVPIMDSARRLGDPAVLVADASYAKQQLAWQPLYTNLDIIVEHAWHALREMVTP